MADYHSQDDKGLLRQIAKGQTEALSELYDRYCRLVFSLTLHITGDQAVAEEATQDVFLRAWEGAGQYRVEQGTVRTWLASIARHRAIDHLRRKSARAETQSVSWDEVEEAPGMEPPSASAQQEAELSMLRAEVRAAMVRLPDEQKEALALAYFRGYTQGEIATALGVPLGTVKTRIRLAMDKLRVVLRDQG